MTYSDFVMTKNILKIIDNPIHVVLHYMPPHPSPNKKSPMASATHWVFSILKAQKQKHTIIKG